MRYLDLFAGLRGWSDPARARGHDVTTLDFDRRFGSDFSVDILTVESLADLEREREADSTSCSRARHANGFR